MNNKSQRGSILVILLVVILGIVLAGAGFFLTKNLNLFNQSLNLPTPEVNQMNSSSQKSHEVVKLVSRLSFDPIPEVDFQSYPVIDDKQLVLIPFPKYGKDLIRPFTINDTGGGGAGYLGTSAPLVSPDLKKTAFISDGVFGIVSADGKHVAKMPKELEAEYLTAWSPDSKKLLVYARKNLIRSMFEGYGITYEAKFDPEKLPGGFYLLDIEKGSIVYLDLLEQFVSWVGNDQILTKYDMTVPERYSKENFILFNLKNYTADAKLLENQFDEYFGKHFSFSADGKKWALSLGNTENSPGGTYSNMIIADFPQTKGNTIAEGTWAQYQGPILSPNGERLIFVNHQGSDKWYTIYWDGKNQKLLQSGRPDMWVGNDQFIMKGYEMVGDKQVEGVYLYDIPSGQETKLH